MIQFDWKPNKKK